METAIVLLSIYSVVITIMFMMERGLRKETTELKDKAMNLLNSIKHLL